LIALLSDDGTDNGGFIFQLDGVREGALKGAESEENGNNRLF
jgi:hypothetical protein